MMSTVQNVVLAIGIFLAGVLVTWVFDRRANRERRPTYVITGNRVVLAYPKRGIEVLFRGERVPVVSRTVVVLWNDGRETIRAADVPQDAPLTIRLGGGAEILEAGVVATTRPEIGFQTHVARPDDVVLLFDHLDHKDGATIEILHTGRDPYQVGLTGTVIGTQGRLSQLESPLWDDPGGLKGAMVLVGLVFVYAVFSFVIGPWLGMVTGWEAWVGVVAGLVGSLAFARLGLRSREADRRRLPTALWRDVPGGLPFATRYIMRGRRS